MAADSPSLHVHLLPHLLQPSQLRGAVAVVIDVLRAGTTIAHALHSGISCIYPAGEIPAALTLADSLRSAGQTVLLGGEREGLPIAGFDLANSPAAYQWGLCNGKVLIFTTSNGTRALLQAQGAQRILVAGFVNFSAVCETLMEEMRPIHLICAGTAGEIALEDTLLAGAFVSALMPHRRIALNDSARLAWDTFECHGLILEEALRLSAGGRLVEKAGCGEDIRAAAQVDRLLLVPEARHDGQSAMRIELGSVGLQRRLWPGK